MTRMKLFACGSLLVVAIGIGPAAAFPGYSPDYAPFAFNGDGASAIGRAKQRLDRAEYEANRGDPGTQFILKQKRRNLCRNNPEIC